MKRKYINRSQLNGNAKGQLFRALIRHAMHLGQTPPRHLLDWKSARQLVVKKWAVKNRDRCLELGRKYYRQMPPEKMLAKSRRNDAKVLARDRAAGVKPRKYHLTQEARRRAYLDSQKKYRESAKWKDRFRTDPAFLMRHRLATRMSCVIRRFKAGRKCARTLELLGCSGKEFCAYLEKQFVSGMSWKNYGKWHVDHIIPCAKFDLSKSEQQAICFHYTNLQPLWAVDNIKKKDKVSYIHLIRMVNPKLREAVPSHACQNS